MELRDFTLRLISPAFVAGASSGEAQTSLQHQGRKPQHFKIGPASDSLRVPSLRGVLRFWFRAQACEDDPERLAVRESRIFGSADRGQGLRILPLGQHAWQARPIEAQAGSARAYLAYGPLGPTGPGQPFSSHNRFVFRDAIPEGTEFRFRAFGSRDQIVALEKSLLLLHLFGGMGSRSRRGWGSLEVRAAFIPSPEASESPADWFERCLRLVWSEADVLDLQRTPRFSSFSRDAQIRLTGIVRGDYSAVFDDFFERFRKTRLWRVPATGRSRVAFRDHNLEQKDSSDPQALTGVPERLAYGLPYSPGRRSGQAKWQIEYIARHPTDRAEEHTLDRRASPLFLKVLPWRAEQSHPGKRHLGVALLLPAEFIGDAGLKIGARGKPNTKEFPGYGAIHDFLDYPAIRGAATAVVDWTTVRLPNA